MYKNLHFKIILIFVIFTIVLMTAISAVLLTNAYNFYSNDFLDEMETSFSDGSSLVAELSEAMNGAGFSSKQSEILRAYSGMLGISKYRNYYILDTSGKMLDGSDATLGAALEVTPNMLSAISGQVGDKTQFWTSYMDYAYPMSVDGNECIIYIKDSQEEARNFAEMIFQITVQAIFFGMLVAIVLSFFLAKAIVSPISELTSSARRIAEGEFSEEVKVNSNDEIGTLSLTFNHMKNVLKSTLDEISGERQKFETLFLYLNDAVLAFDSHGKLMHINKTAKKLFGLEGENDDGAMSFSRMMRILQIDYHEVSQKYRENRNYVISDIIFEGKALDVTFAEFRYVQGESESTGIMCVIHDNTGRYELDKSRREFVADVSHELRTPLTSIKGAVETVLEYPDLDAESRDGFLKMAVEECDRMTRIVSELLVLSRLDNNRTAWKIETFDISQFCRRICDVMTVDALNHGHTLVCNCDDAIPQVEGDREKLQQVMINIVANSVKYTPDGGKITLEAHGEADSVLLTVTDNGVGIPEEDLPRVFERFYRVEKSRTSDAGGTGLGLAIAKEIVDAHGGQIWIESKVGEGTKISVKLPYVTKLSVNPGMETTGIIIK
ncbi:MAG: HAMP domain-containing protein [Clostridia bacterium]|nr:HAMP domain-containing protein [Clostridia bacterium]